tara:strand:- start:71 stop:772 length:702 start_codon:yes stop_codon:yes gene_type:complete
MKNFKYSLSIIIPLLNETKSLNKTIKIISKIKIKKEIIVVISRKLIFDETKLFLNRLKKNNREIKIFYQKKPFVGGAVSMGISKSKFSHVVLMAADLETNPYHLKKFVTKSLKYQNSIICGDRWIKKNSFKRYGVLGLFLNMLAQKFIKVFVNININDFTFAYRIYPKDALKNCKISEFRNGWSLELLICPYKKNYDFIAVSTDWNARTEGEKSSAIKNYISFFRILIYYLFK